MAGKTALSHKKNGKEARAHEAKQEYTGKKQEYVKCNNSKKKTMKYMERNTTSWEETWLHTKKKHENICRNMATWGKNMNGKNIFSSKNVGFIIKPVKTVCWGCFALTAPILQHLYQTLIDWSCCPGRLFLLSEDAKTWGSLGVQFTLSYLHTYYKC